VENKATGENVAEEIRQTPMVDKRDKFLFETGQAGTLRDRKRLSERKKT